MYRWAGLMFTAAISLSSCQQGEAESTKTDNLSTLKSEFLQQICTNSEIEEGPFCFNYRFRTVFFSDDVVSLFGELIVHDRLPRGWKRYEGKTLYKIEGQWKEIALNDLFQTKEQKEFLRAACETGLKDDPMSHFSGDSPIYTTLKHDDIHTFVVDEQNLIVVFQPYSVGGCSDGPIQVKIPLSDLDLNWNAAHPFCVLLSQATSGIYVSSWDEDAFYNQLAEQ